MGSLEETMDLVIFTEEILKGKLLKGRCPLILTQQKWHRKFYFLR